MQTMPQTAVARRGRSASLGAILAVGGGLALYQMTSLVLGPAASRQLPLSLSIPAIDVEELSQPVVSNVELVLGMHAAPVVPTVALPAASHRPPTAPTVGPAAPGSAAAPGSVTATNPSTPGIALAPTPVASPSTSPTERLQPPVVRPTLLVEPTQAPSRY